MKTTKKQCPSGRPEGHCFLVVLIQQIKKIVYLPAILPTVVYISNKSGAIGIQHSFQLPSSLYRQHHPFYTHGHK